MKYDIYKCDRCGCGIRMESGNLPTQVWVQAPEDAEGHLMHFCENCYASLDYFLNYSKEFDELADKICIKEYKYV